MPHFASPVDGTRLHYTDYGPADGPVAVFLSSSYLGTEMWEYQTLPLAEAGYRCVALDRRGHGRSEDVWRFDLGTLADDVQGLLDHLDVREAALIGHSLGAAEIVHCLTRHGTERVARIALVAGMPPGITRTDDNPAGVDQAALRAGHEVFRRDRPAFFNDEDAIRDFFVLDRNDLSAAYVRFMVDRCLASTARSANAANAVVAGLDLAAEMPKIDLPVLVVHGSHDASAPLELTGRRSAALIPGAVLKVYDHAGHGLFATHASQLTADLREFVSAG